MDCTDTNKQFVVFELGNEEYGIDIHRVRTIEKVTNITRVPKTASYVKGVINLRGEIVPVIDLSEKINIDKKGETENTRIIIVHSEDINVGLIVDSASKVIEINDDAIEPPPESLNSTDQNNIIYGIGKLDNRIITLLDVDKILNN